MGNAPKQIKNPMKKVIKKAPSKNNPSFINQASITRFLILIAGLP